MASNKLLFVYGVLVLVFFRIIFTGVEGATSEKTSEYFAEVRIRPEDLRTRPDFSNETR